MEKERYVGASWRLQKRYCSITCTPVVDDNPKKALAAALASHHVREGDVSNAARGPTSWLSRAGQLRMSETPLGKETLANPALVLV